MNLAIPCVLKADVPNVNGLIFTKESIDKMFKDYMQPRDCVQHRGCLKYADGVTFPLNDAAFTIERIIDNGNEFLMEVTVLDTPSGNKLKDMINDGQELMIYNKYIGELTDTNTVTNLQMVYPTIQPKGS